MAFSIWAAYAAFRQKYDSYHATRDFRCNLPWACSFVQVGQRKSPARWKHHDAIDMPGGHVSRSSSVEHRGHFGSTTGGGVSIMPFEWNMTQLTVFPMFCLLVRVVLGVLSCDASQDFSFAVTASAEIE
jgi:hypothetical protein